VEKENGNGTSQQSKRSPQKQSTEKVSKKWKSRDPNLGRADESTNFAMAAAPAAGKRKRNLSEDDAYLILNNKSVVLIPHPSRAPAAPPQVRHS
jgi:hypothetical protein